MDIKNVADTYSLANPSEIICEVIFDPNTEYTFPDGTYFVNLTDRCLKIRYEEHTQERWNVTINTIPGGYQSDEKVAPGKRYSIQPTGGWIWETETKLIS